MAVLFLRFYGAGEAVDISNANVHFLLTIVDGVNLGLHVVIHLADFTNHYFQLQDVAISFLIEISNLL